MARSLANVQTLVGADKRAEVHVVFHFIDTSSRCNLL